MKIKLLGGKMIEEGLEVPKLPTFNVESDSDSSITSTDRTYFVHVFNISWGGAIFLELPPPPLIDSPYFIQKG